MTEHHATAAHPHLAIQFDDPAQQKLSATLGMWAFLATEVMFFGGMFAAYAVYRFWYPHAWAEASRELDLLLGTVNTAVLLTSSLTMALAVDAARHGTRQQISRWLVVTIVLGLVFVGIKAYEYHHKWVEHFVPGRYFQWHEGDVRTAGAAELFFSFYFAMTGLHAFHMLIGFGVLGYILRRARRGDFSPDYYTPVEMSGLYWHFVDIVWVFLFPLLYLIDRT
jgi:cytochrome c oxidase subunit 3